MVSPLVEVALASCFSCVPSNSSSPAGRASRCPRQAPTPFVNGCESSVIAMSKVSYTSPPTAFLPLSPKKRLYASHPGNAVVADPMATTPMPSWTDFLKRCSTVSPSRGPA